MTLPASPSAKASTIEGFARVVRIEGTVAWLEPEQTTSCGSCASAAACGHGDGGIGTIASRIEARRFKIDNQLGTARLHEGERVVVGVNDRALIKAALLAYGLPLFTALVAGAVTQGAYGSDLMSMLGMAAGLGFGLLVARFGAHRLSARGDLAPRYLRRAQPGETCGTAED